ncbi:ABC transporter ATP-binding protein [Dietzia cinnamea]|uniref:ABC transporter ATP-binding protein n=1 Tax=Dietzia cinnamea TaxID=321318 RepID=UPI00223ADD71|nr:ABC transporter ATP-binding protein [Dietzia cinnamea]MCT2061425.1 ABC transporter ATP-binding protein [Dietzia cinnamea]MCT2236407.1 ABC transporter ATP-binding protein [Dietzia cinnamea]MCT2300118.1 ABC transporter ATP-binding protein [Dietzia cinnamea]
MTNTHQTTDQNTVIDFDNVKHYFGSLLAVEGLNLKVRHGERIAILGRTGAGKSTLLNLLIGNMTPTSGTVRVEGMDPYAQHKKLQGKIGMAYQQPRLLPWRTALANVTLGGEIFKQPKEQREEAARYWLEKMHLGDAMELHPSQLSGGMRQRVSLARAFAVNPAFVLLDESFSALDEVTAKTLRGEFVELADEEQITSVIVTHNIEEAFELAHRVILLGKPARILSEYHTSECAAVGTPEFALLRSEIQNTMLNAPSASDPT